MANNRIEGLANLLSNSEFGEFDTHACKMSISDVKESFELAKKKIRSRQFNPSVAKNELQTLEHFKASLNLK